MADNLIQQDIDKFYRSFITEVYRNLGFALGGIYIYIYICVCVYPEFKGMYVRDLQEGEYYFKDFDGLIKFTASNGVNSYIKR